MEIMDACRDGACGGHFTCDITSQKILQAGFVWPRLQRDVHFWCKACDACQCFGPRRLTHEPNNPIIAFGPFEKWGIDFVRPINPPSYHPRTQYIIVAMYYLT